MFNKLIINSNNLINNIKQVKQNNPNSLICAMVKANAYGVGCNQVVQILNEHVDYFGVACFFEAENVSKFTDKKILIVGALDKENINEKFYYTCSSLDDLNFLIGTGKKIKIHLKINTGMNRYGFSSLKEFKSALKRILKSNLILDGMFTHFATTDEFVKTQNEIFCKYIQVVNSYNLNIIIHADNSAVQEKQNHNYNMVRVGFCLYNQNNNKYKPVVELKSKIVQINKIKKGELVGYDYHFVSNKKIKVAVLPIGYADGLDIKLIGCTIKVGDVDCKILNICMDCCMMDITKTKLKKEDYVYLINKDNPLKNFANYLSVSEYQIMCNFSFARADRLVMSSNRQNK